MTVRSFGALAIIVAAAILAACAPAVPTPIPAALHVENRTDAPVVVGVSARGTSESHTVIIKACGGGIDFVPGADGVPGEDWLVGIGGDTTGQLQVRLDQAGSDRVVVDTSELSGLLIMWTTGEIEPSGLPRWVTIEPTGVVESPSAPTAMADSSCQPWAVPPEG